MKKNTLLLLCVMIMIIVTGIIIRYADNSNGKPNNSLNISKIDNNNQSNISKIYNNKETDKNIKEIGTWTYDNNMLIDNQSRRLHNSVWGATSAEKENYTTKSYIYYKSDGSFGWEWNRPDTEPKNGSHIFIAPIYPEVVVGALSGRADYTTSKFPINYGNVSNWTSEINYRWIFPPKDNYNLAYDLYFLESEQGTKKFNVMIWVQGHNEGDSIGIVSDGINQYKHFMRNAGDGQYWEWHAFELINQSDIHRPDIHYKVDIKKLLDNAFPGVLQDNWIIPGVELGSEVWRGTGRIEINKYIISMNGEDV